MRSAVEQVGSQHEVECFPSRHDTTKVAMPISSSSCNQGKSNSDCDSSILPSKKACPVDFTTRKGVDKESVVSESASKLEEKVATPCWMNSEQMQDRCSDGQPGVIPDEAPCTPMQLFPRQKYQADETPESIHTSPSLSLGFISRENQKEDSFDVVCDPQNHGSSFSTEICSSQEIHQLQPCAESKKHAAPTLCKNMIRTQLEVQKEGPELHKENIFPPSLSKYESVQSDRKSESSLSIVHGVGHPPPHRVLASLGGLKMPPSPECIHFQQKNFHEVASRTHHAHTALDCSPLGLDKSGQRNLRPSVSLDLSCFSDNNQQLPEVGRSAAHTSFPTEATTMFLPGDLGLRIEIAASSMDAEHCSKVYSDFPPSGLQKFHVPYTATVSHASPSVVVNQAFSLAAPLPVDGVRYMQLKPGAMGHEKDSMNDEGNGHVASKKSGNTLKRQKPGSSQVEQQNEGSTYNEQCMPHILVEDALAYHREAKKETKKKKQEATEQRNTECVQVKKIIMFTDESQGMVLSNLKEILSKKQREGNNALRTAITTSRHEQVQLQALEKGVQLASSSLDMKIESVSCAPSVMIKHSEQQPSELLGEEADELSVGLKPFTFPAYAQMPSGLCTFSKGDPSLPLSLELSQKLSESVVRKTPSQKDKTLNDADWGESLVLAATPVASTTEINDVGTLPYQQRFIQLQAFLKQCDESDQKDHMQALRCLSAAARSDHAVGLETRAIRLSLEEGKEIHRMNMLNVLGNKTGKNANGTGATPQGPRLHAPGPHNFEAFVRSF